jgi:organic radical activating enzyme
MEHFYTIQGEGAFTGYSAYFIRLAGCDVGCTWCDVKDSWDASKYPMVGIQEMVEWVKSAGAQRVVITGGEPAMYDLSLLCEAFFENQIFTHIETSAAHEIKGRFDWICISPKKFKFPLATELIKAQELKIIVFNKSDFEWAEKWSQVCDSHCQLFLQPEWDKSDDMLPLIIEYVMKNPHWRISLQTHKYMQIP